jgi:hypothetical protein
MHAYPAHGGGRGVRDTTDGTSNKETTIGAQIAVISFNFYF